MTLLERGGELAWACSAGNAGLIVRSDATPLAHPAALAESVRSLWRSGSPLAITLRPSLAPWLARFALASMPERSRRAGQVLTELTAKSAELHAELASGLASGYARRGSLSVYETEQELEAARREAGAAARRGVASQLLTGAELADFEPALAGRPAGALFFPDDAHCDPLAFVREVGRAAAEAGAKVRTRVEVLGVRRRGARVEGIATTAGELPAATVVLAAGAWSPLLARSAGLYLPVEAGKGYHVELEAAAPDPRIPVWFRRLRLIVTPLPGRLRLAGGLELGGLDLRLDRRRVQAIRAAAGRRLVGVEGRRAIGVWRGLRPCSPDGLPIVGTPESAPGLVVATGHGTLGLTLAPLTGRLVADLVEGATPGHDLTPLHPDRFQPLLGRD